MKKIIILFLLFCFNFTCFATVYYNKSASGGSFSTLSTWGTATNGTGTSPSNFTTSGDVFNISNGTTFTVSTNWTLGAGVSAIIGTGVQVTIPTGTNRILGAGTVNLAGTAVLTINNATEPNIGTCSAASTVVYAGNSNDVQAVTYGNLTITATPINFAPGITTVAGNYVQSAGLTILNSTDAAYTLNVSGNFTLSGNACFVVDNFSGTSSTGTVNVGGDLAISSTGGAGAGGPTGDNVALVLTGTSGSTSVGVFQVNGNADLSSASGYYLDFGFGTGAGMAATYFGVKGNLTVTGGGRFYTTSSIAAKGVFFNGNATAAAPQQFSYSSSLNSDYTSYLVNTGTYVQMQTGLVLSLFSGPYSTFTVNGSLDCKTFVISGGALAGGVILNSGASLVTANTAAGGAVNGSITATGSTFNAGANYFFNGAAAQLTGNKMPAAITSPGSVNINNASGVTLTQSTSIGSGATLNFTSGRLALAATTLTLNGTVTGMSAANSITGGTNSNITIGASSSIGTLFFNPTTPGTTNNIATFTVNGAGGSATLGNALNIGSTFNLYNGTLNNGAFLTVANGATINRDNGVVSTIPTWGTGGTGLVNVVYTTGGPNSAAVTTGNELPLTTSNLGNLTISKNAATISLGAAVTVNGALTLTAGTLDASTSNFNIDLKGNWLNNAATTAFVPRSAAVSLTGSATQTIGGAINSVFNNLTLNNSAGAILGRDETINGTLTLSSGLLSINANNLILGPSAPAVAGSLSATNMIIANGVGQVRKQFAANGSFLFPIGDNATANYSPIALNVTAGGFGAGAFVAARVTKAKQPSNLNTNNYLNRYWSIATSGLTSPSYSVSSAVYVDGDIVGSEGNISMGEYSGALPWLKFGSAVAATNTLSSTAVTATSADFTGITTAAPTASSSPNTAVCGGSSTVLSASGSTGDPLLTYSWAPATGLSVTTGVSVTASPAVPTTYTVTVTDGNGFTGTATTVVSVSPAPALTGASSNSPVCAGATLNLSADGSTNVSAYSWAGPVAITNANTAAASVPAAGTAASGIYTVTVSNAGGAACSVSYTTAVTVNTSASVASITPSATNICVGTPLTLTAGATSGTGSLVAYNWTGPNGFSTTSATATTSFTPTSAAYSGNYSVTVTYTGSICNSDFAVTATAVTVNALPTVSAINPSASVLCAGSLLTLNAGTVSGTGAIVSYNWSGPNSFVATTSVGTTSLIVSSAVASGDYSLTVTYPGLGCTSTAAVTSPSVTVSATSAVTDITASTSNLCVGAVVTLNATTSSGTGTPVSYSWSGPDGFTTTSATSSTTFTPVSTLASGNYSVTVSYSGTGCLSSSAVTATAVTVNALPVVGAITPSAILLCLGAPLSFSTTSFGAGALTAYSWSGPAGFSTTTTTSTTSFTPSAVTASGNYSVSVAYSGTGCTSATSVTGTSVTVNALPTVSTINPSANPVCVGAPLTFTAGTTTGSGTLSAYNWSGPNSFTATTAVGSLSVTPTTTAASGDYSVTVTYPGIGCTSQAAVTSPSVTVNALPVIGAITPSASVLCLGSDLALSVAGASGTGTLSLYTWSGPNSFSATTTSNNVSFTPSAIAASGDYSVSVTYSGLGCTSASSVTVPSVTVNALPVIASLTASSPLLCVGASLTLSAGAASGTGSLTSYNWSGPNGYSAATTTAPVSLTPASTLASGIYTLTVTYPGFGCTSAPAVTSPAVTVNALPSVASITPSSANLCAGTPLTFTAGAATGTGTLVGYNWSGPAGYSSTSASNSASFTPTGTTASGNYSVTVTYVGTGCTSAAAVTNPSVTVNALPAVGAITPSSTLLCTGTPLTLTAGASTGAGSITSYNWSGPNSYSATTLAGNTTFTPATTAASGVYSVTVSYSGDGCTSAFAVAPAITVRNRPTVSGIVASPSTLCAGATLTITGSGASGTGGLTSYNWSGPNSYSSTTTTTVQTYTVPDALASGIYSLTVTYPGTGCTSAAVLSSAVTVNALPVPYTVTGGGTYCSGGSGVSIGLSSSESNVNYQLYYNGAPLGGVVAGTGSSLDFGSLLGAGSYSVRATNASTSCINGMSGAVTISVSAAPSFYSVTGGGNYCAGAGGVHIGLDGTDIGVGYQLYNGATAVGALLTGDGNPLDFGSLTANGVYSVMANPGSGCARPMMGSASVLTYPVPNVYNVTGGGITCSGSTGVHIGLDFSVAGINYQLYNGTLAVGSPVGGSASALDFGLQTAAGTYTVRATNAVTACSSNMSGSASVTVNPSPAQFAVTGGGITCAGTNAVSVGLGSSEAGILYQLYNGSSTVGSPVAGTAAAISFGAQIASGIYSVVGTNSVTACATNMSGSASVTINPAPTAIAVTGGGTYCAGGAGFAVGLASSFTGFNYQLYNGASAIGSPVGGTGSAISFGVHTLVGTYTVLATNTSTFCTGAMSGSAIIIMNPLPLAYSVGGSGSYCAGAAGLSVTLSSSQTGVNYQLYNGATQIGSAVAGTAGAISFGQQTLAGTYTVLATNATSGCTNKMNDSAAIIMNALPIVYNVTGGGSYCLGGAGMPVGLSGSNVGIRYQLYNGASPVGSPVDGTNAAITFGAQPVAGNYSVVATNTVTACAQNMSGSVGVTVNALPSVFVVTGGGSYCAGGAGVAVGLNSSQTGINFQLYNGGTAVGSVVTGTNAAFNFPLQTVAGTYSVVAIDPGTSCTSNMFGSTAVIVSPLPTPYTVTGGGQYCAGGTGVHIGLDFSGTGVNYQLYNGSTAVGSAIAGSGLSIDFGAQTGAGTYSVLATNTTTSCSGPMTGTVSVIVNPLPLAYNVTGGGTYCENGSGLDLSMDNSETGINYQLYNGASPVGASIAGNGSPFSFGLQTLAGAYSVLATNAITGCTKPMAGSPTIIINPAPQAFTVTGGGSYCAGGTGVTIGLSNSVVGFNYQLYNGASVVGGPIAGTGSSINFGLQTTAGTYTVEAKNNTTGCTSTMTGNAVITINPLPQVFALTGGGSFCVGGSGVLVGMANTQTGINYQLYNGASAIGSAITGTGAAISFGLQTGAGTYSVLATNITTGCTKAMGSTAIVVVNTLPSVYAMYGSGNYCTGSVGVHIGMFMTDAGVNYQLYNGSSAIGAPLAGAGSGIDFGITYVSGTYTVQAINAITGCTSNMSGSATVGINTPPSSFSITGGGTTCANGSGVAIGLAGSAAGINYSLYRGSVPVGAAVPGTNAPISFGLQTVAGTYTVLATDAATGCTTAMTGSASITVNPVPLAFSVTGGGSYCPGGSGVNISLSGSESNVAYQVYFGSSLAGTPVAGTGGVLSLGLQSGIGAYTVQATNSITGCSNNMTGSVAVSLFTAPVAYNVTGGGSYCSGSGGRVVGLSNSQTGITYRLYNGTSIVSTIAGTNTVISFGPQLTAGTYTVLATDNTTTCTNTMSGSAVISVNALPLVYNVSGGGSYCAGGSGFAVTLGGSDAGINYQLYNGSSPVGSAAPGTGSSINFGTQTTAGVYTVFATSSTTGCLNNMAGSATIIVNPLPQVYSVTGGGSYCAGGAGMPIGLSGSQSGVNYRLYNGSVPATALVPGTGTSFSFGSLTPSGIYTVLATSATSGCTANMLSTASITINTLPVVYNVTGGGNYCQGGTGVNVGIDWSVSGVNYQLYRGSVAIGSPLAGIGGPLDFGFQTVAGAYSVAATNAITACSSNMAGTAMVGINPLPAVYTISGGGSYCAGGNGVNLSLSGSDAGINYQLFNGTTASGASVPGVNSFLNLGPQTAAGIYTVAATNPATGCRADMSGSALISINPAPLAFAVTGGGGYCATATGAVVGLAGSATGVSYRLYKGGVAVGVPVTGTGASLSFGIQGIGTYSVLATDQFTACTASMTGSVTVSINPAPVVYDVTGGGGYCAGGAGVIVGLSGSDAGVNYSLYLDGSPTGTTAVGNGSAFDFGLQLSAGLYTVIANNITTGCVRNMSGSKAVTINPLPVAYSVSAGGSYCAGGTGVFISINGSNTGVNYQLYRGATAVSSIYGGNGSSITFIQQTVAGNYTVMAADAVTSCFSIMSGSANIAIDPLPGPFTVIGGGAFCNGATGVNVSLSGSETGVNYYLYNGTTTSGIPTGGTGGPIDFGTLTTAGVYTVYAVNPATTCNNNMTGSAQVIVNQPPIAYDITGGGSYCAGGTGVIVALNGSQTGVNYQLSNTAGPVGAVVPGNGSGINFGLQTTVGDYFVTAVNATSGCTNSMSGTVSVSTNPLPFVYTVTGGGAYCLNGNGVSIGLGGSELGMRYRLYRSGLQVGAAVIGTGNAISFGLNTLTGSYTVIADNVTTGCSRTMSGSAVVSVNTLPEIFTISSGGSYCASGAGVNILTEGSETGVSYQLYNGSSAVGGLVAGTGFGIDFGAQTVAGTYTVQAVNDATSCVNDMLGAATISIDPLPVVYDLTGGGAYCPGGNGTHIGLSGSQAGMQYQLYIGATAIGAPVAGTGFALDFGLKTVVGTYTAVARSSATSCSAAMAGSATIMLNALPVAFNVTGGGSYCPGSGGVHIGLNGSESGVNYQLYNGTTATGAPVAGTGNAIDFGLQLSSGTYTVVATNVTTSCSSNMSGDVSVAVNSLPVAYNLTGGGNYCPAGSGVHIGIDGSESGVNYQLVSAAGAVGFPLSGSGTNIDFGLQTAAGAYSVIATNVTTGCSNNMSGNAVVGVNSLPGSFTLISAGSSYCAGGAGVSISLAGSATGIEYQLYANGTPDGIAHPGTGGIINFGLKTVPAIYTAVAKDITTSCIATMPGTPAITISPLPAVYSVIGGGSYCAGGSGVAIGVGTTDAGINYQLYNGTSLIGTSVPGNGGAISFGAQTLSGSYTVIAKDATSSCSIPMSGSAVVSVNPLPAIHAVTGGGVYCAGGTGVHIGVSTSNLGIQYQLYNGATPVGSLVNGTGNVLDLGLQTATGVYSVLAINATTGCSISMTGSATVSVNSVLSAYNVTGGGGYCTGGAGVHVGLSGSATGINYRLYNGSTAVGSPLPGTGSLLDFGIQAGVGTYSVLATNPATGCTRSMFGSVVVTVNALPAVKSVTGGGTYCAGGAGVNIGLNGSAEGVNYLLYNGGTLAATVAGNDDIIDFGNQSVAGTYTVVAVNSLTGCSRNMLGSALVAIAPVVVPSVNVTSAQGDTVCAGTFVIFTATQSNGGSAPVYQWKVNGANVGFATSSYSYFPADGDVVSITLTSSTACAMPSSVSSAITMSVRANQAPVVTTTISPNDSVCSGSTVTFTAMPVFGGTAPAYVWTKNGSVAGTGATYSYIPANGDLVFCKMTSNYTCRSAATAVSATTRITVIDPVAPSVTITADPGTSIAHGQRLTLTAAVANGGTSTSYQWLINNVAVAGAVTPVFINDSYEDGDIVTCQVTGSNSCGSLMSFNTVTIRVSSVGLVAVNASAIEVRVMPNPNNGEFYVNGLVGTGNDEVTLVVTDMLGQQVSTSKVTAHNGIINERVILGNSLASGMYLLDVRTVAEHKVFHVIVKQ